MPSARASSSSSSSSAAAAAKLTKLESALYRAAQSSRGGVITQDRISEEFKHEELGDQLQAINGLLKKSLFTAQTLNGSIQFHATAKAEASMMGKLDENETMVYSHIKDSKNEGIWTKQLKARTGLHQTIINRCLKSLESKQLVKAVKSVKYPTRKIYMLFGLTPSIELSGGPWYTDNELDTGFINELSMACLNFIRSKSFPKNGHSRALFPTSHTSQLPSAHAVHSYLRSSGLTETKLELEHVVSLLDILVYDEQVEKIPVMPYSFGGTNGFDDDAQYSDSGSSGVRSRSDSDGDSGSDNESQAQETGSDSDTGMKRKNNKSKIKKERKTKHGDDQESQDESDDDGGAVKSGKRKRSSSKASSRKKSKASKSRSKHSAPRSRSRVASSSSSSSSGTDGSASESDSDDASGRKRRSRSRSKGGKSSSSSSSSAAVKAGSGEVAPFVYRAIRPHSVKVGWTETPCGHCPVFDFCDDTGPVNAATCQYFGGREDEMGRKLTDGWIDTIVFEDDEDDDEDEDDGDGEEDKDAQAEAKDRAE